MAVKADACFPLCLPFLTATSPVKKAILENPQIFQNCKYKNNFPLMMAKAHAAAIQNRPLPGIQTPRAVLEWSKREKGW